VSDHGEEFREHGGLYHLTTLFEEQVRIPGWLIGGQRALDPSQRSALAAWTDRRTFSRDVNATILDLLGVFDARSGFPFSGRILGRSLLRAPPAGAEPVVPMSTGSGVCDPDISKYGAMSGDLLAVRSPGSRWDCYDVKKDPAERVKTKASVCANLFAVGGTQTFGEASR